MTRVALITGSGKRRVGASVAEAFAERGYRLAIHHRTSRNEANTAVAEYRSHGIEAIALQADLTDEPEVEALVRHTLDHFGRIDVLIHAAAVWPRKTLEETTANDVRAALEANAVASYLIGRHVGLQMAKQPEGGAIVLIGDWATIRPYVDYSAYFLSKGAIPTLTRTLAIELAARNPNVRVNCILPGPVMLPADLPEAERRQAIAGTLVKREGRPEHVAQAALFLVDNDFVTGICLPVDGGRSIFASDSQGTS